MLIYGELKIICYMWCWLAMNNIKIILNGFLDYSTESTMGQLTFEECHKCLFQTEHILCTHFKDEWKPIILVDVTISRINIWGFVTSVTSRKFLSSKDSYSTVYLIYTWATTYVFIQGHWHDVSINHTVPSHVFNGWNSCGINISISLGMIIKSNKIHKGAFVVCNTSEITCSGISCWVGNILKNNLINDKKWLTRTTSFIFNWWQWFLWRCKFLFIWCWRIWWFGCDSGVELTGCWFIPRRWFRGQFRN